MSRQSNYASIPTIDLTKGFGSTRKSLRKEERNKNEMPYCTAETPSKKLFMNSKRNFLARLFMKRKEKPFRECDDVSENQLLHCESPGKGSPTKSCEPEEVSVTLHNFPTANPSTVSIPSRDSSYAAAAGNIPKTCSQNLEFETDLIQHGQPSSTDVVPGDTFPSPLRQASEHGFPATIHTQQFCMTSAASVHVHYDPGTTDDPIIKKTNGPNHLPRHNDLHKAGSVFSNTPSSEYLEITTLQIGQEYTGEYSHVTVIDTNVACDKLLGSSCDIMDVCKQSEDEEQGKTDELSDEGSRSAKTRSKDLELKGLTQNGEKIPTYNIEINSIRKPFETPYSLGEASPKAQSLYNGEDERHTSGYKSAPSNNQEPYNIFI